MPMSAFGRSRWFGDDEEQDGPTPLFPATAPKESLFPVKSDESPVLSGLKGAWKGATDWLNGPADSDAGGAGGLLAYKPTNRWGAISDALGGAAKGVMHAKGPYANWLGEGLLGAGEGLEASRKHDLELRKLAQEQQYKSATAALAKVKALTEARKGQYLTGKPGDVIYDTMAPGGTPTPMAQIPDTTTINGQLVDKATGKPIGAAVPPQPTTIEGAVVQGLPLGADARREFNADITQKTKPVATQVSVSPSYIQGAGETKEAQTIGEQTGKTFAQATDRMSNYQAQRGQIETMKNLVQRAPQGPFEEAKDYWRAAGVALTGNPNANLDTRQVFTGMANKLVKDDLGSLGASVSEGDVNFASKMAANPGNTKGANEVMLEMRAKALERQNQLDQFQVQWRGEHGNMLAKDEKGRDFWSAAQDKFGKSPLYDDKFQEWANSRMGSGPGDKPDYKNSGY